jgi:hypothetical protein
MTGQWSKEYMDETSEMVLNHMINLSKAYFDRQSILSQQLKMWQYAEVVEFLREPYLELSNKPPLMIAGDAFLSKQDPAKHTRLESAFTSGVLAADRMHSWLSRLL